MAALQNPWDQRRGGELVDEVRFIASIMNEVQAFSHRIICEITKLCHALR